MPKFGPRKMGEAAFKAAKLREKHTKKFGPKKYGARKAAEMKAELAAAEALAAGESEELYDALTGPVAPVETTDAVLTATSIKQIEDALQENPALYEELYALELERPDGPRKGALRIFLAAEMNLESGPRDERLSEIEDLLKPKK